MEKLKVHFVDRRLNPKGKSLANQQRLRHRVRQEIREAVHKSIADTPINDADKARNIKVKNTTQEPRFRLDPKAGGERNFVLPGNKTYVSGDTIDKPKSGQDGAGKRGHADGEGQDDFEFRMSREDILDIFFEDLELPNMERTTLKETPLFKPRRSGISTTGTPSQIDLVRTMRQSIGRRIALKRPSNSELDELSAKIAELEDSSRPHTAKTDGMIIDFKAQREAMLAKRRVVAFVDPIDVRYRAFSPQPVPTTKAVMFCLMDVSISMGEREKDLAKCFYLLLNLFLKRHYEKVDLVFIRHDDEAEEVDEHTFFHATKSGGTIVSSGLRKMEEIANERYPRADWNIYGAQASDGHNLYRDNYRCIRLMEQKILPMSQYYTYIEICDEGKVEAGIPTNAGSLWEAYADLLAGRQGRGDFAMRAVGERPHIPQVFHHLFARSRQNGSPVTAKYG